MRPTAADAPKATRLLVTIHLNNGSHFEFEADSIKTSRSPVDNRLTALTWEGTTKASGTPLYIDLDHVIAIVVTER